MYLCICQREAPLLIVMDTHYAYYLCLCASSSLPSVSYCWSIFESTFTSSCWSLHCISLNNHLSWHIPTPINVWWSGIIWKDLPLCRRNLDYSSSLLKSCFCVWFCWLLGCFERPSCNRDGKRAFSHVARLLCIPGLPTLCKTYFVLFPPRENYPPYSKFSSSLSFAWSLPKQTSLAYHYSLLSSFWSAAMLISPTLTT